MGSSRGRWGREGITPTRETDIGDIETGVERVSGEYKKPTQLD